MMFRPAETAARLIRDLTRVESLWRRKLKRSAGDASEEEERASTCAKWTESEVVDSDSSVKDSDSGHERIGEEGRVLTTSVWYWEEEEEDAEEKEKKRTATEKIRVVRTFRSIGNKSEVFKF